MRKPRIVSDGPCPRRCGLPGATPWDSSQSLLTKLPRRRLEGQPLRKPVTWKRRVGGKFGADVSLPAGCYSDDTQCRLATGRAVHNRGFDVEAFARVELPIWPVYALGGGKATKAAAANLAKPGTPWFGNTFDGWLNAGGNGVAMRIQPHVWAAAHPESVGPHLVDVIINGIVTHGHPRALVGAVLHAVTLGITLETGQVPSVELWPELLEMTLRAVKLVDEHFQLTSLWRPIWESAAGVPFDEAWEHTVDECRELFDSVATLVKALGHSDAESFSASRLDAYEALITRLALREPASRGSGTATVVAAIVLAASLPSDPAASALVAAQALGTDTDTIATMAAGIVGACQAAEYPAPVLDSSYIGAEAVRLADIASGNPINPFSYPDLLNWTPPRAQLDAVGLDEGRLALAGLGWLDPVKDEQPTTRRDTVWQWMQSDFGASFLIKRRESLKPLPDGNRPQRRERSIYVSCTNSKDANRSMPDGHLQAPETSETGTRTVDHRHEPQIDYGQNISGDIIINHEFGPPRPDIDSMLSWVVNHGLSDQDIGYAVRRLAEVGTIEQMIALVTTLVGGMK